MQTLQDDKSIVDESILEEKLKEFFEANFQNLKETSGHTIDSRMKEMAYNQVLCYVKKNLDLIKTSSCSEVKLSLPEQKTPLKKYPYTLEGKIDLVRQNDKNCLYDITTRSIEQINGDIKSFSEQLNVYAHIWKSLDKNNLIDELGIISTSLPKKVQAAIDSENDKKIAEAFNSWNPLVKIQYSEEEIEKMINNFGEVVEKIRECDFPSPSLEKLLKAVAGTSESYASHVCSNCDIRFSCESYKKYKENKADGKSYSVNDDLKDELEVIEDFM